MLKATTLMKYFKQHRSENNKKLRLEKLACSGGANIHTTIRVINCFSEETRLKARSRTTDLLQTNTLQKFTRLQ